LDRDGRDALLARVTAIDNLLNLDRDGLLARVTATDTSIRLLYLSTFTFVTTFILFYVSTSVNFKKLHNMGSDRVGALEKISFPVTMCGSDASAFAISAFGHEFGVTVAHFPCNSCPSGYDQCENIDISLILKCPPTRYALDASKFAESAIGDDAFVFGFAVDSSVRNYHATIGGRFGSFINGTAYNSQPIVKPNY